MKIYPALTISLLSQLTDLDLQSNYLNHLDRTSEIASLLTQIIDKELGLRIVNLALEVDHRSDSRFERLCQRKYHLLSFSKYIQAR